MNEYMKPDYEVMEFAANEYVAACDWVQGTILELLLSCGIGNTKIELGPITPVNGQTGTWSAYVKNEQGQDSSGTLWFNNASVDDEGKPIQGVPQYGFQGYVPGHDNLINTGEFKGLGSSVTDNKTLIKEEDGSSYWIDGSDGLVDSSEQYFACHCDFHGTNESNNHHHVMGVYNHSHS